MKAALSAREGLAILKMIDVDAKKYEVLGRMTQAIIEATKIDGSIDLEKAFDESKTGKKALNDQLRVALGVFRETIVGRRRMVEPTEPAAQFFSNGTKRTNFAHILKKCAQCAAGLIEMKAEVKLDEKKGTLVISGPAVAKEFGKDTLTLDERMSQGLTQKPSYTAIVAIAKARRGVVTVRGSGTRGVGEVISADSEFELLCKHLIEAIRRCGAKPNRRQANALRVVSLEIKKAIG
ncbi:hypothetical protein [Bradyrhizobium sp. McL0616]|uniref:hypothetical protein n=1 Tax=Bradyrhizobium sp. McL0616 TaxID=3415674 RepID=UPI003CEB7C24